MTTPKAMTEAELDAFEWHADGANRPTISRESLKRLIAAARAHLSARKLDQASGEEQKEDGDGPCNNRMAAVGGGGDVIGVNPMEGIAVAPLPGDGGEDEDGYSFDVEQLRRNLKSRDDYLVSIGKFSDYADSLPSPQGNVGDAHALKYESLISPEYRAVIHARKGRPASDGSGRWIDDDSYSVSSPDSTGVKERLARASELAAMKDNAARSELYAEALRVIEGMEEELNAERLCGECANDQAGHYHSQLTAAREAVDVKNDAVIRLREALYISYEKLNEAQAEIERLRGALEKIANINRYDGYASIARAALTTERDG
jgi:hypothetical protein